MATVNVFLEIAKQENENLISSEVFLVLDLFKGYEWNRISRSDKLLLGTHFLNYIKNSDTRVEIIEKTISGQQKYKIL